MSQFQSGDFWQQRLCPEFIPIEEVPTSTLSVLGVIDSLWHKLSMKSSKCIISPRKRMDCVYFPWLLHEKKYCLNMTFPSWQEMCASLGLRHGDGEAAISSILGQTEGTILLNILAWQRLLDLHLSKQDPVSIWALAQLTWAEQEEAGQFPMQAAALRWQWMCRHGASQGRAQLAGRPGLGVGLGASFVQHSGEWASKSIWEISGQHSIQVPVKI